MTPEHTYTAIMIITAATVLTIRALMLWRERYKELKKELKNLNNEN